MCAPDGPFVRSPIWWQLRGELEDDWVAIEQLYYLPRTFGFDHRDAVRLALGTSIWLTTFEGVRVGGMTGGRPGFAAIDQTGDELIRWLIGYWRDFPEDGADRFCHYCLEHPSVRDPEDVSGTTPSSPR